MANLPSSAPSAKKAPASKVAKSAAKSTKAAVPDDDSLPDKETIAALLEPVSLFMADAQSARIRAFLQRLAMRPPQVLLLEGGTADERLAAANYWAALLNCPSAGNVLQSGDSSHIAELAEAQPCLTCPDCIRMITHLHRDCFYLDGAAASIKIDDVRAVRSVLGEPPREARYRVVIFREAQAFVEAAANALLKSFEEPRPATSFVMLAPQRERLLPTLVSRSMVLTLPWPVTEDAAQRDALAPWEAALCTFLRTGQGFFERTGTKGAVDVPLVQGITGLCRRALAARIAALQSGVAPREGLETVLAPLSDARLRMLDEALAECHDSLLYTVNPTLVLEWLVTRMYFLLPRTGSGRR